MVGNQRSRERQWGQSPSGLHSQWLVKAISQHGRRLQATNSNLALQLVAIAYQGIWDGKEGLDIFDFSSSVGECETFLSSIKTWGGDGKLANVAGGALEANSLNWQQPSHTVFLIADVPCHGSEFHNPTCCLDEAWDEHVVNCPKGTPGIDIVAELKNAEWCGNRNNDTCVWPHHQSCRCNGHEVWGLWHVVSSWFCWANSWTPSTTTCVAGVTVQLLAAISFPVFKLMNQCSPNRLPH